MLAGRIRTILPEMNNDEALENLHGLQCRRPAAQWYRAGCGSGPFRSPHHTITAIGLIGGRPGAHPGRGHPGPHKRHPLPR